VRGAKKLTGPDFGASLSGSIRRHGGTWRTNRERPKNLAPGHLTFGYLASFLPLRYLLALNSRWLLNAK
jgi:hypothetical protein